MDKTSPVLTQRPASFMYTVSRRALEMTSCVKLQSCLHPSSYFPQFDACMPEVAYMAYLEQYPLKHFKNSNQTCYGKVQLTVGPCAMQFSPSHSLLIRKIPGQKYHTGPHGFTCCQVEISGLLEIINQQFALRPGCDAPVHLICTITGNSSSPMTCQSTWLNKAGQKSLATASFLSTTYIPSSAIHQVITFFIPWASQFAMWLLPKQIRSHQLAPQNWPRFLLSVPTDLHLGHIPGCSPPFTSYFYPRYPFVDQHFNPCSLAGTRKCTPGYNDAAILSQYSFCTAVVMPFNGAQAVISTVPQIVMVHRQPRSKTVHMPPPGTKLSPRPRQVPEGLRPTLHIPIPGIRDNRLENFSQSQPF